MNPEHTALQTENNVRFKEMAGPFFIYFFFALALCLVLLLPHHLAQRRALRLQMESAQKEMVETQKTLIGDLFSFITSDLMVLAHQQCLQRFIENDDASGLWAFGSLALSMARYKEVYDQIRFIDLTGMERVRIQGTGDTAFRVPLGSLQDKAHRYYVRETRKLPKGAVYVSPLDLNVENHAVERPFKPMIRIATPIYDGGRQYKGMVILNYRGDELIQRMRSAARQIPAAIPHFINREGYWFLNDRPETQWGFMFKEKKHFTFDRRFPRAWEAVKGKEAGQVFTPAGLFSFSTLYPVQECRTITKKKQPAPARPISAAPDPPTWKIISLLPRKHIDARIHALNRRFAFLLCLLCTAGALTSWFMARYTVARQKSRQLHQDLLRHANEVLEERVKERTRRLSRTNAQLLAAKTEAENANIAKSNFLASMSHELRTPLNAVIGFSEVLADQFFGPLNEKQMEYVKDILHSGRHLLVLINDILDLAKVEAGQMRFSPGPVTLPEVISESLKTIGQRTKEKEIQVTQELPEDIKQATLWADPVKLKQIFHNLLSNAAKFTPPRGWITITAGAVPDIRIHPPASCDPGDPVPALKSPPTAPGVPGIEICIQDSGIGLAPDHLDKIFDTFFQVENGISDKTPGTGLGLPLVKRFVEMHGGRIGVHSDGPDRGSRFCFTLPLENRHGRTGIGAPGPAHNKA